MYVVVKGISQSAYSIIVQLLHNDKSYSEISLSENIEYTVRIPPAGAEVVKVHPIFDSLYFKYRSSSEVFICLLEDNEVCKKEKNPNLSKKGQIAIPENKKRTNNIVIGNPSDSMYTEVKMSYHSADYAHCEERAME